MAGAGLPISIIFMLYSKYNIDLSIYVFVGSMFCLWICGSRLYLGMHSLLDVIAGILYSILIIITLLPVLETIDLFLLENKYSPCYWIFNRILYKQLFGIFKNIK